MKWTAPRGCTGEVRAAATDGSGRAADLPLPPDLGGHFGELMRALPPDFAAELRKIAVVRHLPPGAVVLEESEEARDLGYIVRGTLAMVKRLPDQRVHILGLLVPTDMFGRVFDGPNSYRVETLSDCVLYSFDRQRFETILRASPEAERTFLVHVLDELDAAREWLILISGHRVTERAASFLLLLARRMRDDPEGRVEIPLSRRDLAHYLGVRPESLSRAFRALAERGAIVIDDPYHFRIADMGQLVRLSGQDLLADEDDGEGEPASAVRLPSKTARR